MQAFTIDHDYHIHSCLSSCSGDKEQNPQRILDYAVANGFRDICLTDHFWDETVEGASDWYRPQNYPHICESLPLPQHKTVTFHFGCETEMDKHFRLGISAERMAELEFIIVPTTHLHMDGFTIDEADFSVDRRRVLYLKRWEKLLSYDLPFHKIGIAHLTCSLMSPKNPDDHLLLLNGISDAEFCTLFCETARLGAGVELNIPLHSIDRKNQDTILRPYRIAKECGCKFYFGSDAHYPTHLDIAADNFRAIASALNITEKDRFFPFER